MVKKLIGFVLAILMSVGFYGCASGQQSDENPGESISAGESAPAEKEEVMPDENYKPAKSSDNTELAELMEAKMYTADLSGKSYNLLYRFYLPENYNEKYKYPLVVYFHGYGECGSNNLNQLSPDFDFLPNLLNGENLVRYPAIVIAPQCPVGEVWATKSYDTFFTQYDITETPETKSMRATLALMDQLGKEYSVDQDRIYVTGVSMGGLAAWDLTARYPEKVAACVPVCGAASPVKNSANFKDVNVWAFQGQLDPLVRPSITTAMVNAINQNGGKALLTLYPDADHTLCWVYAFNEENLYDFLFCSRRGIYNKYFD